MMAFTTVSSGVSSYVEIDRTFKKENTNQKSSFIKKYDINTELQSGIFLKKLEIMIPNKSTGLVCGFEKEREQCDNCYQYNSTLC